MSIYAIGDMHGCFTALTKLFNEIPIEKKDTFIFLGDYVDKGPDTKKVIDWLLAFSEDHDTVFIKGNHEIFMSMARANQVDLPQWKAAGGESTLASYEISTAARWAEKIPDHHWQFLNNLSPYHQVDEFLFVHAGLLPLVPLEYQTEKSLFWEKYEHPKAYMDKVKVICGHTARKDGAVADFGHTVCIDTYAHGGQWLTALEVRSGTYYQASEEGKSRMGKLSSKS